MRWTVNSEFTPLFLYPPFNSKPQLWQYFALSKTLVPQAWQKLIADIKRKSQRWRQPCKTVRRASRGELVPSTLPAKCARISLNFLRKGSISTEAGARFLRKDRSLFQRRRSWLFLRKRYISTERTHFFIRRMKWKFLLKKHSTVQRTIADF